MKKAKWHFQLYNIGFHCPVEKCVNMENALQALDLS